MHCSTTTMQQLLQALVSLNSLTWVFLFQTFWHCCCTPLYGAALPEALWLAWVASAALSLSAFFAFFGINSIESKYLSFCPLFCKIYSNLLMVLLIPPTAFCKLIDTHKHTYIWFTCACSTPWRILTLPFIVPCCRTANEWTNF